MTSPGILLFGERVSELQAVARAIVSPSSSLSTTATATAAESTTTTQQWTIDNKYYTAQLVLSMLTTEQHMADLPSLIDHQAVVAVFNAATATLPQVQELWTAAENHNINYEIKMVVALCTECSAPPKWLDEADAWCATRLAEFVVVQDLSAATPIESIPATERRDEDGLQRVIEALQAHMWPGMQRKSTPARNTVSLDFVDDDDDEEEDDTQVGEPSVEALLQAALRAEDDADDVDDGTDEFDRVFAEVVGELLRLFYKIYYFST